MLSRIGTDSPDIIVDIDQAANITQKESRTMRIGRLGTQSKPFAIGAKTAGNHKKINMQVETVEEEQVRTQLMSKCDQNGTVRLDDEARLNMLAEFHHV